MIHFFWKKVYKKFGTGVLMMLSLQPQSGTDVLNKRRRWEGMMGWFTGFYVVQSSSEYCPGRGLKKKLQKFLLKSLEVMKKSLPLQPLSETKRTFWNILTDVFFIFCGWSLQKLSSTAVPKKKFEKKVRKDLEGICKSIYLCIRFRLISGAGKREAKRVLKDIERFENKQQVRVREEIQRI